MWHNNNNSWLPEWAQMMYQNGTQMMYQLAPRVGPWPPKMTTTQ